MTCTKHTISVSLTKARSDREAKKAIVVFAAELREKFTVNEKRTERGRIEHVDTNRIVARYKEKWEKSDFCNVLKESQNFAE